MNQYIYTMYIVGVGGSCGMGGRCASYLCVVVLYLDLSVVVLYLDLSVAFNPD